MHDLRIIDRQLINTNGINTLSLLLETAMTNTIYLIKPKQLYVYKKLEIQIDNNIGIILNESEHIDRIKEIDSKSKSVTKLIITGYNGIVIELTREDILGLRGFKLINHVELAIEYYKSTIYDILYNPDLISLCRRNPKLEDYGMDILEEIEASPSICLTDGVIDQINQALIQYPDITNELNRDFTPIRNIINKYLFNPKEFSITRYTIRVYVLEDIRVIRFNELMSRGDVDDNEDSGGVYISK